MDPYMLRHNIEELGIESDSDTETQDLSNQRDKRTTRGPIQMRGIWGSLESEGLIQETCNEFGQPDDEVATKLSNFMGTVIRDKMIFPLTYSSWHKTKFDLHDSMKTWTMQKFGKKLKDWRQLNFKDQRVEEAHFEYLLKYWSTDQAREISRRNQASRG
ncbi:hypothetical protein ACJIZ3_011354 [Penstemon smallii]|uniref:Uncharacterized protein n=1 Tax=Penstemon smallii TaxID=265156 RepID=A0ABD3UMF3_9LAMI